MYTPNTAQVFRTMAGMAAWEEIPDGELPIQVGVHIDAVYFLRRPKRLKAEEAVRHTAKPDLDNLDKSLRDGLQHAGVLSDDCKIYSSSSKKFYTDDGKSPRCDVTLVFDPEED